MRSFKAYHTNISFIDLLFNTVLGFAVFFIIAFILMTIQKSKISESNIKTQAEIVVTMTWEDNSNDDVDLWIKDPANNILFFRKKEVGVMYLDRDDLGYGNNIVTTADGKVIILPHRQEIATIRGFIGGEWIINAHMYNKRNDIPVTVSVKVEKLNPTVKIISYETFQMSIKNEQVTIIRFTMTDDGKILSTNRTPIDIVSGTLLYYGGGDNER